MCPFARFFFIIIFIIFFFFARAHFVRMYVDSHCDYTATVRYLYFSLFRMYSLQSYSQNVHEKPISYIDDYFLTAFFLIMNKCFNLSGCFGQMIKSKIKSRRHILSHTHTHEQEQRMRAVHIYLYISICTDATVIDLVVVYDGYVSQTTNYCVYKL